MDIYVRVYSSYQHTRVNSPFSVIFCNYFQIHSEAFSVVRGFFPRKGFHVKSLCFSLFTYFIIVFDNFKKKV